MVEQQRYGVAHQKFTWKHGLYSGYGNSEKYGI